jgi:hypothetical protein
MESYSLRRLQPFMGVTLVVQGDGAAAISLNGTVWQIELRVDGMHRGWSILDRSAPAAVPYGFWSPEEGMLRRLPLPPMMQLDQGGITQQAEAFTQALAQGFQQLRFPQADHHELWLLDDTEQRPLALLASSESPPQRTAGYPLHWKCYEFDKEPVIGQPGQSSLAQAEREARQLEQQVAERARRGLRRWFQRDPQGQGISEGQRLDASLFPQCGLREDWPDQQQQERVQAYLTKLAPRLLALPHLDDPVRQRYETAAWELPLLVHYLHPTWPQVLDHSGFDAARVKARLMLHNAPVDHDRV